MAQILFTQVAVAVERNIQECRAQGEPAAVAMVFQVTKPAARSRAQLIPAAAQAAMPAAAPAL
jgi:hypothetical protein